MTTLEVKLNLSEQLARDAEAAGLLKPKAIERLLRDAVRRNALRRFLAVANRVKAAKVPSMSLEAIQAEVRAVRKSKRAAGC